MDASDREYMDSVVLAIEEVDPNGQTFRYPESIKGDQHLAEWSIINLAVVSSAYERTFAVARKWHYQIEGLLGR